MQRLGRRLSGAAVGFALAISAHADITLDPYYAGSYRLTVIGSAPGVPANYGGLTIKHDDNGTLLLGGAANTLNAKVYGVGLERDSGGHIVGFDGAAAELAGAYGTTGGIDGGLAYGPGDVLFYTAFFANQIGQIEPGSTGPDKLVNLTTMNVTRSVGGLGFVPEGMPGAGRLKITSTLVGRWYDAALTPDGAGTYNIVRNPAVAINIGGAPQGIAYVPAGSPLFPTPTVLVAQFESPGRVSAYQVNTNGDPITSTRRTFIHGLEGAEGVAIDPLTGDFLFSTYDGGNLIVRVSAVPEPATWALLAIGLAILSVMARRRLSAGAAAASSGARAVWPPAPAAAAPSGISPA